MGKNAYDTFIETHARGLRTVNAAVELYKALENYDGIPSKNDLNKLPFFSELVRAGVVVSVAAFDRYFTTRFAECVTPILQKQGPTPGLLDLLDKAGLDLKGALDLLHMQRPHRRLRALVSNHLSDFTTQKFVVIDKLYLGIGISNITENAQKKVKRKNIKTSIEKLIRRRHIIVHAGDVDGKGRLYPIDVRDTVKRIESLKMLVTAVEEIVANRMKSCTILPTKKVAAKRAAAAKKKAPPKRRQGALRLAMR